MTFQDFVLSFRKGVFLIEQSEFQVVIQSELVKLSLNQLTAGLLAAIRLLASDGATHEHLSNLVLYIDGHYQLCKFYNYLQKFDSNRLLSRTVALEGLPIATIVPISLYYKFDDKKVDRDKKYVLSRFAYCHTDNSQIVLESPLSYAKIILHDWRGAVLINELSSPLNCSELGTKIKGISEDIVNAFLQLLLNAKAVSEVDVNGTVEEEENVALAQWEFHDLLFHSRSRQGRHNNAFGATYRFLGKIIPLPAVKPKMSLDIFDLYKPDLEKLTQEDLPFTHVLEERKSIRSYADKPITDQQLGEFLYRIARVKRIIETDKGELSSRPYPGGGAIYELELYVTINTCENLPSGLYHYYPVDHQLCKLSSRNEYVEQLLVGASLSAARICTPQVLITLTARFQRMSWKYNGIAYAATLKHVGVLYQTMYLVATAMGIAPCGLGCGNSDLFVRAAGTDYYQETSVGEFMLGSKSTD